MTCSNAEMRRLAIEGQALAYEAGLNPDDPGDCIWALTVSAADAYARTPMRSEARGYPTRSAWPEMTSDAKERRSVEWVRGLEKIDVSAPLTIPPTPREIERAEEVARLWQARRFAHMVKGDPVTAVRALWLYAGGSQPARIKALLGVNRRTLLERRVRFCAMLGAAIEPHLKHSNLPNTRVAGITHI